MKYFNKTFRNLDELCLFLNETGAEIVSVFYEGHCYRALYCVCEVKEPEIQITLPEESKSEEKKDSKPEEVKKKKVKNVPNP